MSEHYRFFDSIDGEDERLYTADEFAEYFRQFIRNGIFNGGENLQVTTDGVDMTIKIKLGYAWIEGYLYKIDIEPLSLRLDAADPTLNRIDRIVIRLDKSLEKRYVKAFILKGIPAANPTPPDITRNENVYEISLAKVNVVGGKSFIKSSEIIDERFNANMCGIVTHLFEKINTTNIFNRFEIEFYEWFNELQNITNLVTKTQLEEHKLEFNNHTEEYASETRKGHIQIANMSEVINGTNHTKAVTPLRLKSELDKKLSITNLKDASTTQKGIVQLNNTVISTSTTQASTANVVKGINDEMVNLQNRIYSMENMAKRDFEGKVIMEGTPYHIDNTLYQMTITDEMRNQWYLLHSWTFQVDEYDFIIYDYTVQTNSGGYNTNRVIINGKEIPVASYKKPIDVRGMNTMTIEQWFSSMYRANVAISGLRIHGNLKGR